jgi:dTDP-4-amino-4,6-dideoxygalactose transaminase
MTNTNHSELSVPLLDLKPQYAEMADAINAAIQSVVSEQAFILGPKVEAFESAVASYCGVAEAIGISSGTDALMVAMMAMGIGAEDEVITTPYTFFGTVGTITRLGAKPVFVDIDPLTFNIDANRIADAVSRRTRVLAPVHLFGQCADMTPIRQLARDHHLEIIEDAAQAIGARYGEQMAGAMGHVGCLSFFPTKNLGGFGDGGMILTDDRVLAQTCRCLRNHGMEPKYFHSRIGGNFRLDALQAAVLQVKLPHLDRWQDGRRANAATYRRLFEQAGISRKPETLAQGDAMDGIILPTEAPNCHHVFNQFVIYTPKRDALLKWLREHNVGCEIYYPLALHMQECFRSLGYREGDFPHSERAAKMSLALPIFPDLSQLQLERVVSVITDFFKQP